MKTVSIEFADEEIKAAASGWADSIVPIDMSWVVVAAISGVEITELLGELKRRIMPERRRHIINVLVAFIEETVQGIEQQLGASIQQLCLVLPYEHIHTEDALFTMLKTLPLMDGVAVRFVPTEYAILALGLWQNKQRGNLPLNATKHPVLVCEVGYASMSMAIIAYAASVNKFEIYRYTRKKYGSLYLDASICAKVCQKLNGQFGLCLPDSARAIISSFVLEQEEGVLIKEWLTEIRAVRERLSAYNAHNITIYYPPVATFIVDSERQLQMRFNVSGNEEQHEINIMTAITEFQNKITTYLSEFIGNQKLQAVVGCGGEQLRNAVAQALKTVGSNEDEAYLCLNRVAANWSLTADMAVCGAVLIGEGEIKYED